MPAEPRLQAVAAGLMPQGISGTELSRLEDAWEPMFAPFPWGDEQVQGFRLRGRLLFGVGARLLAGDPADAAAAGALWSLVDGAGHVSDAASREMLMTEARAALGQLPAKVETALRPMTILAALAAADCLGKGRGIAALKHRLLGTFAP